jgi:hypothetical protein
MSGLISDLIVIGVVLLGLTMTCAAWGRAAFRLIGITVPKYFDCGALWLGFSALLACIEFLHLFTPIDWRVSSFIFSVSLLPLLSNKNRLEIKEALQDVSNLVCRHYLLTLLISLFALIWCLRSMGLSNNFDSGLYHFGSIRWMNEYPIVLGLGNLHWRLALNQSYFGFLSLINIFPFWNKGYAVGGLFLTYLTTLTLLKINLTQQPAWRWIVGGLFFIFLGYLAGTLSNPSPDTAVGLLEIVVFCFLFRIIQGRYEKNNSLSGDEHSRAEIQRDSVVVLLLSLALITIKLSSIAFALTCMSLVIYFQFIDSQRDIKIFKRQHKFFFKLFILMACISVLHIVRGYLLSGAPFFPSTFAGAWGLDWAVLKEFAEFEVSFIYSWARDPSAMTPGAVLGHWGWVSEWLKTISLFEMLWMVIASLLMFFNLVLAISGNKLKNNRLYICLYLPIIIAFIFWFLTAPNVRFLGAVPVLYLALSVWLFYIIVSKKTTDRATSLNLVTSQFHPFYSAIAALIICLFSLKSTGLRSLSFYGWADIPQSSLIIEKTLTDLPINVPAINGQCWDAPLPCASVFNGNLHADPIILNWPLTIFNIKRFFYSVKFLNLPK